MKKFIALVVVLCAVMISSTASAADWSFIRADSSGDLVYVDLQSINYDENYKNTLIFHAFVKNSFGLNSSKALRKSGIKASYAIGLIFFKNENGIKYISVDVVICYDSNGKKLTEYSMPEHNWKPIMPDDDDDIILYNEIYQRLLKYTFQYRRQSNW